MSYVTTRRFDTTRELTAAELPGAGATYYPVACFAVWHNESDGYGELPVRGGDAGFISIDADGEIDHRTGRRHSLFSAVGLFDWLVANNWLCQADSHAAEFLGEESVCGRLTGRPASLLRDS